MAQPASCHPILQLDAVSRRFGSIQAVDDVSLRVDSPQTLALLGVNGAGKSTLLRLIAGVLPLSAGAITINGISLANSPVAARGLIGYLPENAPVLPRLRVKEALHFAAEIHGLAGKTAQMALEEASELCQLNEVQTQLCENLSKGYRHRLGLAMAMLHRPPLLILDEPTDGLDPKQKAATRELIRLLGEKSTVIVSTHILEEVPAVAQRVILMDGGKITYDGAPPADLPQLFSNNRQPENSSRP